MMLPKPNCSFSIPSLYDDLELNCRLYFPRRPEKADQVLVDGFAVLAHPYAPLGGTYDDPVVQGVGSVLLQSGLVLCTFNFRGAHGSSGSASWTGKAELGDYVSVCAFVLQFINAPGVMDSISTHEKDGGDGRPLLIMGGYSYGSMIASHMPDIHTIQSSLHLSQDGSADLEIKLRALDLSKAFLGYLDFQNHRGRNSSRTVDDEHAASRVGVVAGGYESPTASSRINKGSPRHSVDSVRHSIERIKNKLHTKDGNQTGIVGNSANSSSEMLTIDPRVAFLLVSPLLPPVTGLLTLFSRLSFERRDISGVAKVQSPTDLLQKNLTTNPTHAIFGDHDVFSSAKRMRKWSEALNTVHGSVFTYHEVERAGHFWHEDGVEEALYASVAEWVQKLIPRDTN